MSNGAVTRPAALVDARAQAGRWWQGRAPREQQLLALAVLAVVVLLVWLVAVQPALKVLHATPPELAQLDLQLQQMQLAALESESMRAASPVPPAQAAEALRAATQHLGDKSKLAMQGDRATLTFTGIPFEALRGWLGEARSGARARPVEAQFVKAASGYTGSISVTLPGGDMIGRRTRRQLWSPTLSASSWSESTLAEKAWVVERGATLRWAVAGAIFGILLSLLLFAPAAWVAQAVASATDDRLLLADAQGTVWSGSAVVVLTGGAGSRDARYLPGRAEWTLSPRFYGAELVAREACCIGAPVVMQLRPGFGRMRVTVVPPRGPLGEWPSAWLSGYGTPLNTLQLGGTLRLISPGFTVESVQGRWRLEGRVDIELDGVSSRLTTLDTLGSYRLTLSGGSADSGVALLSVSTDTGPLQITGSGTLGPGGIKFRGEARAATTDEAALSNLLNIIGRRDGARSVISIG